METTDIIEILDKIYEKYGKTAQLQIDIYGSGEVTCVMPFVNINKRCIVVYFNSLMELNQLLSIL